MASAPLCLLSHRRRLIMALTSLCLLPPPPKSLNFFSRNLPSQQKLFAFFCSETFIGATPGNSQGSGASSGGAQGPLESDSGPHTSLACALPFEFSPQPLSYLLHFLTWSYLFWGHPSAMLRTYSL